MMMSSSKVVTEYPMVKGTLEWEVRNLGLHFEKCPDCWAGEHCYAKSCYPQKHSQSLTSTSIKLAAGSGNQSEWHFKLTFTATSLQAYLFFDGLFGPDGSRIDEPLTFGYNAVVTIDNTAGTTRTSDGKTSGKSASVNLDSIYLKDFKTIWPDGNLKVTVQISHLSDLVNTVFHDGQPMDTTTTPVPSCYGNLMNNPDLSDFKILCDGSTFHAHKFILSVRSRVFRAMLEAGMSESTKNELKIKDMTVKTVGLMLEYIYKGIVESFPEEVKEQIELLDCAEKYELDGLKSICMGKLFSNPATEKDVGELAMAAFTYGANDRAVKAIKDFCMKNHFKLMQNPEYKKLFLANPQVFVN